MDGPASIYRTRPMAHEGDVLVFAETDRYVDNYRRIAEDHMEVQRRTGTNPFIEESAWRIMEAGTAAMIAANTRPGSRILDVGVGTGRLLSRFEKLERYGVDISFDYIRNARKAGIDACFARAEDLPYHDAIFDTVVCTDVLEHVLDVNATLAELRRVLKPKGVLIIRVPYREDLAVYLANDYPYEFAHLRNFDEFSLALLLSRIHGFDVSDTGYVYLINGAKFRIAMPLVRWFVAGRLSWLVRQVPRLHTPLARLLCGPSFISMAARRSAGAELKT